MAKHLIETLANSKIYQDYERAFSEATGLPVSLRSVDSWQLPHHGKRFENPFCAMLAQKSRACAACLQVQQQLSEIAGREAQTVTCPSGLCDIAIPVRMGEQLVGFLTTGQVFCKKPAEAQFNRTAKLLAEWGVQSNPGELRQAYFDTRVLSARQHESIVKLLSIFAEHLSMVSNQVVMQEQNAEPPVIARAKQFITDHQMEELSLDQVAKSVHTSKFYFCKMFKKATGLHFTDYLARVRTESAKNLLLNRNLRISEIAYEVGFQSLTHFNRVFKRILGHSPTDYRSRLTRAPI
ncbi:MAG TPA: PocR ligand-binding domain-containing protein [Verrucomicrobiae bacterium]|nr:PocR ligand-binding domain-containing protein [Verrucomicrobiae bacterium]